MTFCAFCYHEATKGKLCETCEHDRVLSEEIQKDERARDPEYHMLAVDDYTTQENYIKEFWARFAADGQTDEVKIRRKVTASICDEIGCAPRHYPKR